MTALAMIIGMAPMALGLGEGGEQNAPLGRAVIGGLVFATVATLMFVPVVFSMMHEREGREVRARDRRAACRLSPNAAAVAVAPRAAHRRRLPRPSIAVVVVVTGITTRKMADARLSEWTEDQAVPTVAVATPDTRGKRTTIDLPGRLEAYSQAQIYARVSGYLKEWKADIGAPVKAGQLLAEIEAPDLDQQIMQAEAERRQRAGQCRRSPRPTLQRGQSLVTVGRGLEAGPRPADGRSRQQAGAGQVRAGQSRPAARAGEIQAHRRAVRRARHGAHHRRRRADQRRARAAARRCSWSRTPASCAPTSTFRRTTCRASRSAPRRRSRSRNIRARTFTATVEASAQSVDVASGTTRMLLVVDNAGGELMTGAFANVRLELPNPESAISVPASALIFDQSGLRVATVGADDRVRAQADHDLARSRPARSRSPPASPRTIASSTSPPDGIASGDQVRIAGAAGAPETASTKRRRTSRPANTPIRPPH